MPYYHVKIHTKQDPKDWQWIEDLSRDMIEQRLLAPYRAGSAITLRGKTTRMEDIDRITIDQTDAPWGTHGKCMDVTDDFITGPPGSLAGADRQHVRSVLTPTERRKVFVVHGRNEGARRALFTFLRSIGLDPLEWSEAIKAAGHPNPYIGDILDAAFSRAHAVVVLFTPDDSACLHEQFRSESDPQYEMEPTGQARPNVLFEAGMAMGRDPNKTVLVEMGTLRPFSDIGGRHLLRIDNSSRQRHQLAQRLKDAGCPVKLDGTDWHAAGDFDAALELTPVARATIAVEQPQLSPEATSLLRDAAQDARGIIRKIRTLSGLTIETNGKEFGTTRDPESEAVWKEAINDLLERALVEDESGNGQVFRVTREGFRTVQQLSNGKATPEASRTEDFRLAAHKDSKAVGESIREREDQAFINAVTDFDDE